MPNSNISVILALFLLLSLASNALLETLLISQDGRRNAQYGIIMHGGA